MNENLVKLENTTDVIYNIIKPISFDEHEQCDLVLEGSEEIIGKFEGARFQRLTLRDFPNMPPRVINFNGINFTLHGAVVPEFGELLEIVYYDNMPLYENIKNERNFILRRISILASKSYLHM